MHFSSLKKSIAVLLPVCFLTACAYPGSSQDFDAFTDELFISDVSQNAINLHFTLNNPENYGIKDAPVTLGEISREAVLQSAAETENTLSALKKYKGSKLSKEQQLTYDVLSDYLQSSLELSSYTLYEEILKPSTGIQAQLPILYEEYQFHTKQDIENYLTLLEQTDSYFSQIAKFEQQRAKAGLFMSDYACNTIISQCKDFITDTQNHYLITSFNNKIDSFQGLSQQEQTDYKQKNLTLLNEHVFPAYSKLASALRKLCGFGKNDKGLCYFEEGRNYYEELVYYNTGYSHSIEEISNDIKTQRSLDLLEAANLCSVYDGLWETCQNAVLNPSDAMSTLGTLRDRMVKDFPAAPKTNYSVSYIDACMEEYVAPAFYITAPIDDPDQNAIYINASTDTTSLRYFTTLAHEGFPGHLYQTVMSYQAGLPELRFLLNYPGYVEGWATYVEMISYGYAGLDANAAKLLALNQSAILSLYASTDIGIHYEGWDYPETKSFWESYGISNEDALREIYELIVEEPAHYLKYYVGYLGFLRLKQTAQETFGDNYCDTAFHQAVLSIGPAPFSIVEKYLPDYYPETT